MIRPAIVAALLTIALPATALDVGTTAYISDELTVPLRSGASGQHRIIHRGLPSGTRMEVLGANAEAGFTQIRTDRGTEGWIRTQYLVAQPIAKARLAQAQNRIASLQRELASVRETLSGVREESNERAAANAASTDRAATLERELNELKRISAAAVETHEENLKLQEINARLHDELDDVAEERDVLAEDAGNEGIMLGAGFILLGLIAGVLIKARPQRSAWS